MASDISGSGTSAPTQASGELANGLEKLGPGGPGALDRLVPLLYDDLRLLARERLRSGRAGDTLDAAALVHVAYFRLLEQRRIDSGGRSGFLAAASRTLRRVLVDSARARERREGAGGDAGAPVEAIEPLLSERASEEALAADEALDRLERSNPRAASVVELRLFGGLAIEEIGELLGVPLELARRDWRAARAWLRKEVRRGLRGGDAEVRDEDTDDAGTSGER